MVRRSIGSYPVTDYRHAQSIGLSIGGWASHLTKAIIIASYTQTCYLYSNFSSYNATYVIIFLLTLRPLRVACFLSQNCPRNDLRRPKIQNFSGGACPQTPLAAHFARYTIYCNYLASCYSLI